MSLRFTCFLLLGLAGPAFAVENPSILHLDADPAEVYMREAKKVEVRVEFEGDASGNPPASDRKWNLVQVGADGERIRYIGVLLYSARKRAHFKKFDVQQNQPETLYFEVVPDGEVEPFVKASRRRLEVRILRRPSLPEVLRGIWKKLTTHLLVSEAFAEEPVRKCRAEWREAGAGTHRESQDGVELLRGDLPEGGVFAQASGIVDLPLEALADRLWNPELMKDMEKTRLQIEPLAAPAGALRSQQVTIDLNAVFWIHLKWRELWTYRELQQGSRYRIEYSKLDGEPRLRHFCGWMDLRRMAPSKTELSLYEEVQAPVRSSVDAANGHRITFSRVRKSAG